MKQVSILCETNVKQMQIALRQRENVAIVEVLPIPMLPVANGLRLLVWVLTQRRRVAETSGKIREIIDIDERSWFVARGPWFVVRGSANATRLIPSQAQPDPSHSHRQDQWRVIAARYVILELWNCENEPLWHCGIEGSDSIMTQCR